MQNQKEEQQQVEENKLLEIKILELNIDKYQCAIEEIKQENKEEFDPFEFIDKSIFENILESDQETDVKQGIIDLKKYLKENSTQFGIILKLFEKYFETENGMQKLQSFMNKLPQKIPLYHKCGQISLVYRSILQIYQNNQTQITIDEIIQEGIAKNWKLIHQNNLLDFFEKFQLNKFVSDQEIIDQCNNLIQKQKFNESAALIKIFEANEFIKMQCLKPLIEAMTTNKNSSKAADIVKSFKLDTNDFPQLKIRLDKNCVRYYLREKAWYFVEDLFQNNLTMLGYVCEDLYFRGEKNEAYTIAKKYNLIDLNFIQKNDIRESLINEELIGNLQILPQPLYENDSYNPVEECLSLFEKGHFLHLTDFKIQPSEILIVEDTNSQVFKQAVEEILQCDAVGLDSEFSVSNTKFDDKKTQICLIQIATSNKAYIFDMLKLQTNEDSSKFFEDLLFGNIKKSGQSISGDFDLIKIQFNFDQKEKNVVELSNLYKRLYPEDKASGLAHITKILFDKQLSKQDQVSNWIKRPLRKSQIHYAAMDAVISLQCYLKFKDNFGNEKIDKLVDEFQK